MDAKEVIIHFIGIVMFSTQVSNDPGLHAILPAIPHPAPEQPIVLHHRRHPAVAMAVEPNPAAALAGPSTVEPHVALLIVHRDDIANESKWATTKISKDFPHARSLASYNYVKLSGEHLTFIVDAPGNALASIPKNMPRFSCNISFGLASGYQWPYSKATAVVDIPEGTLSVCSPRRIAPGRIDTRLTLNTTGTLTIVGMKSGVMKTLVLRTTHKPTIYLTNIPPSGLNGATSAVIGLPHFQAYFEMIDTPRLSTCSGRPNVSQDASDMPDDCNPSFGVSPTFVRPGTIQDVGKSFAVNAECSNTQWP